MTLLTRSAVPKVACAFFLALTWSIPAVAVAAEDKPKPHKTDWLYEARWGVMYHYVSNWKGAKDPKEWSKMVDEFDVKALAKQLKELGAGYFVITVQHAGLPLVPSAVNEKREPGICPKRDLVADLADELGKNNIRLMLYYATGMGIDKDSAKNAAAVIEELSKRYGKKVSGWWLDNNSGNEEAQKLIADAARSGNPDALIGFSPPKGQQRNSPYEDYTAGNTHAPGMSPCEGRFIQDCQWHMLTYLGYNWGGYTKYLGKPRYDPRRAAGFTTASVAGGGAITWDVPHQVTGQIHPDCWDALQAIGKAAREAQRTTPASKGIQETAKPKAHKTDWLHDARWGIFYHYSSLEGNLNSEDKWNEAIAKFDIPAFIQMMKDLDARYFLIAARSKGLPLAPASDSKDGKFPKRDLIAELGDALAKENIRLMLYFNSDDSAKSAPVIRELSKRYGKGVSGWWFDGSPENNTQALAEAAKAGNPDTLIAFGWSGLPHQRVAPEQDFTGGRTNMPAMSICERRFTQGLQWHTLGTFGFNKYQQRYNGPKAAEITARHVTAGGVMTWDAPWLPNGQMSPEWLPVAKAVGECMKNLVRQEPDVAEEEIRNPTPPPPPQDAVATTLTHKLARCISAKMDWWPERQEELGLVTSVGRVHAHFIRSQLLFDLSKVDKTKPVHSAALYLHCGATPMGEAKTQCNQVVINRFTREIGERDQKWYLYPVAGEGEKLVYLYKPGLYAIDVTEIVKDWLGGQANYGFRLTAPGLGANWQRFPITWKSYNSKTYDPKENPDGPRLVIYQLPK